MINRMKMATLTTALCLLSFPLLAQASRGTELGNGTEGIQIRSSGLRAPIVVENLYEINTSCQVYAAIGNKKEPVVLSHRDNLDGFVASWQEGKRNRELTQIRFRDLIENLRTRHPLTAECQYQFQRRADLEVFTRAQITHVRFQYFEGARPVQLKHIVVKIGSEFRSLNWVDPKWKGDQWILRIPTVRPGAGHFDIVLSQAGLKAAIPVNDERSSLFFDFLRPLEALDQTKERFLVEAKLDVRIDKSSLSVLSSIGDESIELCTWSSRHNSHCVSSVPARWAPEALSKLSALRDFIRNSRPDMKESHQLKSFAMVKSEEPEILETVEWIEEAVLPQLRGDSQDPIYKGSFESWIHESLVQELKELMTLVEDARSVGAILPDSSLRANPGFVWAENKQSTIRAQQATVRILNFFPQRAAWAPPPKLRLGDEITTLRGIQSTVRHSKELLASGWPRVDRLSKDGCSVVLGLARSLALFKYGYLDPIGIVVDPSFAASLYVQEIMLTLRTLNDFGYKNEGPAEFLDTTLPEWEVVCSATKNQILDEINRFKN